MQLCPTRVHRKVVNLDLVNFVDATGPFWRVRASPRLYILTLLQLTLWQETDNVWVGTG